jgi:putative ABC transport system permease protein
MNIFSSLRIALEALFVNKFRSFLTSLGIIIGIMSVIAMVAAGSGAKEALDDRLDSVGKNLIIIRPGGRGPAGIVTQLAPLTAEDIQALRNDATLKHLVTGVAESQLMPLSMVSTNTGHHATSLVGVAPEMFTVRNWKLSAGRLLNQADQKKSASVCVIGETVRKKLFPNKKAPLGERLRIGNIRIEVVGVLQSKGRSPMGQDQDDQIFLPLSTLQDKIAQERRISIVVAGAKSLDTIEPATKRITEVLRTQHRLRPETKDDFDVSSVQELSSLAVFLTNTLNILVVVIASISLVVGGIGIMNIMLVSVTERTREIGIRMAVGATPSNVRNQFLIESVVLSLVGGTVGVLLGVAIAALIAHFLHWPFHIDPFYVILAFCVSALVGVFFGFYPAAKASQLDPIEALRYE